MNFNKLLLAVIPALLTACGGGGGGGSSVANADPQGFWSGLSPAGYTVNAVVILYTPPAYPDPVKY